MFKKKKIKLPIKNNELKLVLIALTELRNTVIQQGRYADPVDELILKLNK